MRTRIRILALLLVVLSWGAPASGISFDEIVSLGDSLFDDPLAQRSPLVPEHIAARLGVPLTQLAVGGATSSSLIAGGQHTTAAANFGSGDLAMLWIGGNDFLGNSLAILFGNFAFIDTLEANVDTVLTTLTGAGLDVVVFNLPDLSQIPGAFGLANFRAASQNWNARLLTLATSHGAAYVDVFQLFEDVNADPADFAVFGNVPVLAPATGCQLCVFFDSIHPSSVAQGFVTNTTIAVMNPFYDPGGSMPITPLSEVELGALLGLSPPCSDGIDNDADGATDFVGGDPGCDDPDDVSERRDPSEGAPFFQCDDGIDNDSDGRTDFDPVTRGDAGSWAAGVGDPGCESPSWGLENPQCQDGTNNDFGQDPNPGLIDFDGGQSIYGACGGTPGSCPPGVSDPDLDGVADNDPQCGVPWKQKEKTGCGLGFELALLLPPLMRLRRRRPSRR